MEARSNGSNMEEQDDNHHHPENTRAADRPSPSPSPSPSPATAAEAEAASEPPPSTSPASAASSSFSSTRSNASPKKPDPSPARGDGSTPRKLPRMILINPPSAFHPDIHPPSLVRVQRALYAHGRALPLGSHHLQHALPASAFRDEQGRFILEGSSGGYYVGDVLGGRPHGHGQHHIPLPTSGRVHLLYDGEWTHGSKTGSGSVFYTNGEEYQGELRHNQRWGHGRMRYKDGSFYAGDWLRGRRHGIGIHYFTNGNCYCGAFCKDSQDGWGTFYWPSMRRKFEGEWVANQPYSGYYSQIGTKDFEFIGKTLLQDSPQSIFCLLLDKIPTEEREIAELNLQNPIWTIFNVISVLRSLRAGDHDSKILFKTQVGRKENLTSAQLQTLKKLFEVMAPVTDNKAQLHVTHLRRMLVLARINPDIGQGEKLLAHLQTCTTGKTSVGFDELLLYILQYHHP